MPATASRPGRCCDRCGARLAGYNRTTRCAGCSSLRTLREPLVVPREFWDDGEMRDALATLHMGRVVYAYRMHPWHGQPLKQSVVGGWFGLTQTQVSRIENGRAPEEMSKLIRWARLLGVPGELLWFDLPCGDSAAPTTVPARTLPVIVGGRAILLPIDEQAARARGLDDLLDQCGDQDDKHLDRLPLAPHVPSLRNANVHALLAADRSELERLAAALDDARRYLDGSVVGLLREELGRCKAADGRLGPVRALPLTLGILGAIAEHVREVKPDVRGQLLSLGAEGAEFAGWLYRDLKDPGSAMYWYDRAMEWAQEANDRPMQGYVLLRKSQMAYESRDAHRVATFAVAAGEGPWLLPAMVRVEVSQQEARGLAMLGEPIAAVERKLDEAQSLFAGVRHGEQPRFAITFTESALQLRNASCYIEAGKPGHAADLFEQVLNTGELSRRDEGYYRARRAFACALSGLPDDAAREGLLAWRIAATTSSQRTARELARTVKALEPWNSRPGARQLREALNASL